MMETDVLTGHVTMSRPGLYKADSIIVGVDYGHKERRC